MPSSEIGCMETDEMEIGDTGGRKRAQVKGGVHFLVESKI